MADVSMANPGKMNDGMDERGSWAIGGTTMMGVGIGFFFLPDAPLMFVASIIMGIGVGLVLAAALKR